MKIKYHYILFIILLGCTLEDKDPNAQKIDKLINDFLIEFGLFIVLNFLILISS